MTFHTRSIAHEALNKVPGVLVTQHAWSIAIGKRGPLIAVYRRGRAARWSHEWHNYRGVRYFSFGWASPTDHRWWARHIVLYISR